MNQILHEIEQTGIVPVATIEDAERAVPLALALKAAGISCMEVTFRTEQAVEAIRNISGRCPDMLVGAGTVLTVEQVELAVEAGARFIVSPGLNPAVVKRCQERRIVVIPGVSSPGDVERAIELGLDTLKVFPAEQIGGLPFIKAIAAPYKGVKFMPTGGLNAGNIKNYYAYDRILACGGSWMVKPELIREGNFEEITKLSREALYSALDFQVKHIGINCANGEKALDAAGLFGALFGFSVLEKEKSVFASNFIELMKEPGRGKNGHIAVSTSSVPRAAAYLERRGISLDYSTARNDLAGNMKFIYLAEPVCDFAIHLVDQVPDVKE